MRILLAALLLGLPVVYSFGISSRSYRDNAFSTPHSAFVTKATHIPLVSYNQFTLGSSSQSSPSDDEQQPTPLCDLQTFLKMCGLVKNGGEAKHVIQDGQCDLNGEMEIRRAKKLFRGDKVSYVSQTLDVADEVSKRGYVYKKKVKKVKPEARVVDADGTLEFGGRYRSDEWRAERKQKKAKRKAANES